MPRPRRIVVLHVELEARPHDEDLAVLGGDGGQGCPGDHQPQTTIGNVAATGPELRAAAERAYRDLATLTSDRAERIQLVDAANSVRPRTLV